MANRVLNLNLFEHGSVIQSNQEGVTDGALSRIMVLNTESFLFDTVDLGAELVDAGVRSGSVGANEIINLQFDFNAKQRAY